MGGPMAASLVRAGHTVTDFDLAPAALDTAHAAGIAIADSPKAAVADTEIVFTMLPAGGHVLAMMADVLSDAKAATVFVDCSTIDVASARAAHLAAQTAGMLSVDAPVSGGVGGRRQERSPSWWAAAPPLLVW
jgi:3-hydroxyisobutyrate dehydrogenase